MWASTYFYKGIYRPYVVLMYYTDNPKSMKALKKYQDIYLLKVKKETVAVC